jgi:hypothetical protein
MPEIPGVNPESGLYHVEHMPLPEDPSLRAVREKQLVGEPLSIGEAIQAGRDATIPEIPEPVGDRVEIFPAKPDHVYRAVDRDTLQTYQEAGAAIGFGEDDEYEPGNNRGVDWYLGGVALKYGDIVIEAPADPQYFKPADKQGSALAIDPNVRHMKSSGHTNPVPMELVKVAHDGRGEK